MQTNHEIQSSLSFPSYPHAASRSNSVPSTTATRSEAPAEPGADSFKKDILIQLGISPELSNRTDHGLHHAYEKYKAYLQACKTYGEMTVNKSWVGGRLTGADIIQLFISKSYFHSHYKKFFSKVSNYPDMVDWLEGNPNALADGDLWGEEKGSYTFKDLEKYMEKHETMKKKKKKGKDDKGEGGSRKPGDKKKKKKQVND